MEMNDDILKSLRNLNTLNNSEKDAFIKGIADNSLMQPREIVRILHSDNPEDSAKAALITIGLKELSFTPLFELLNLSLPDSYVWDAETIVTNLIEVRKKVIALLEKMLLDKRDLKDQETDITIEEQPPSRRVCDAAYVMLRQLFAYEEDEETLLSNINVYMEMSDEDRDKEISRIRETRKWQSLIENVEEENF